MIIIKLPGDIAATVNNGVWAVPDNEELAQLLNEPHMQPDNGHYAPSADARMAEHVLKVFGGKWISSDERAEPGKLY